MSSKRASEVRFLAGVSELPFAVVAGAGTADAAALNAQGSVEQVYATGLTPGAPTMLVSPSGRTIFTRAASSLGEILFLAGGPR